MKLILCNTGQSIINILSLKSQKRITKGNQNQEYKYMIDLLKELNLNQTEMITYV